MNGTMKWMLSVTLALAACGGGGDNPPDAPPPEIDATPQTCQNVVINPNFGALGTLTGVEIFRDESGNLFETYALTFETDNRDYLSLELYAGHGAFSGGITPLTDYAITGEDLGYDTCGLCLLFLVNQPNDLANKPPEQYWMARSGTVTLSSVQNRLTGTLNNIVLKHVNLDPTTLETTEVNDNCQSIIVSATFDDLIPQDQPMIDAMPSVDAGDIDAGP